MIRAILIAVVSAAAVLPATAQARDIDLRLIHFYESGYQPAAKGQRRYVSLLPRSSTRFVYWEITVHNKLYQVRDHTYTVVARWYRPNGSLLGTSQQNFLVRSGWSNAWISHGKGYRTPGRWAPGKYKVDILVDGSLFARRQFLIYDDARVNPDNPRFTFTRVRLFEGASRPPPAAQRQYTTRFDRATTRYIYVEVTGRNLNYGNGDFYPMFEFRFFKANGAYNGAVILDRAVVRSSWRTALLAAGWGARVPNNWAVGSYRVEVWQGTERKVGEAHFTVYSGAPPSDDDNQPDTVPPDTKPPGDRLPAQPPKATPPPATPAPKAPDKPKDLEELEKL